MGPNAAPVDSNIQYDHLPDPDLRSSKNGSLWQGESEISCTPSEEGVSIQSFGNEIRRDEMDWRKELGALGKLAMPLVWNHLSWHICDFTDCLFLGHLGALELGAAGMAMAYMSLSFLLILALSSTLTIVASQSFGAHNKNLADLWFQRALVLSCFLCVFVAVSWINTDIFLSFVNPDFAELGALYAYYSLYRIPAETISIMIGSYLEAQEILLPTAISALIGMAANVVFNYVLIYGAWGYEGLGFIGSPLATALTAHVVLVVEFAGAACMTSSPKLVEEVTEEQNVSMCKSNSSSSNNTVLNSFPQSETDPLLPSAAPSSLFVARGVLPSFAFSKRVFNVRQLMAFVRLAAPQALSQYMEEAIFLVMSLTAGSLGVLAMAANTIVLQIYEIATCCFFGVAGAACIRIGNAIGAGRIEDGKQTAWLSVVSGMLLASVMGGGVWVLRDYVPRMFSNDESVISECATALPPAAVALIMDAIYVVITVGILGGLGNTRLAAFCCAALAAVSPLTYVFALKWGFAGIWPGWLLGTVAVSIVSVYFWQTADWNLATEESNDRAEAEEYDLLA